MSTMWGHGSLGRGLEVWMPWHGLGQKGRQEPWYAFLLRCAQHSMQPSTLRKGATGRDSSMERIATLSRNP